MRAGASGDKADAGVGSGEPLADWEQSLIAGGDADQHPASPPPSIRPPARSKAQERPKHLPQRL